MPGVPSWLVQSLITVVGLPPVEVAQLSGAGAMRRWNEFISTPHRSSSGAPVRGIEGS